MHYIRNFPFFFQILTLFPFSLTKASLSPYRKVKKKFLSHLSWVIKSKDGGLCFTIVKSLCMMNLTFSPGGPGGPGSPCQTVVQLVKLITPVLYLTDEH